MEEALERMRLQTRQYARRQMTWFRRQLPRDTVIVDASLPLDERLDTIEGAWRARTLETPIG